MTDKKDYGIIRNEEGNPNIVEYGVNTRFGQPGGADPSAAARKSNKGGSIRTAVRRIACMPVEQLEGLLKSPKARSRLSVAELTAIYKFRAVMQGNVKAMQQVTDDVDGKLVQKQVNSDVSLEQLVTGSFDYDESSEDDQPLEAERD